MARKTANEKLHSKGDLPKIVDLSDNPDYVKRYGGTSLYVADALQYDAIMAQVPEGKLTTTDRIRALLAARAGTDATCPLTAGIFTNLVAAASVERQDGSVSKEDYPEPPIAWWRTLKKDGEINPKYPGAPEEQITHLRAEGHHIEQRGKRFFVTDYESALATLS
ncbi:MAG: MGMT family protein [Coriobacteriia bacterium]|nr:MGMT family protein [Coriobacteriia bacterium]MCL2537611.1 MGMT family protein [Coriobacteriia bacterium]